MRDFKGYTERAKSAAKETAEWVGGIGLIVGTAWMLNDIPEHVRIGVDHRWWAYQSWKWYWHWWPITVPHTLATVVALFSPMEENGPTRRQLLFTWNSAVAGFWGFLFGILWTVERLGPWLGIPIFLSAFVSAGIAWTRLDARFGYWQRSAR